MNAAPRQSRFAWVLRSKAAVFSAALFASAGVSPGADERARDSADLELLVADLVAAFAPRHLSNRILTLSADGGAATPAAQESPALGELWIRRAEVEQAGPRQIRLTLDGMGWRWVDRTTETAGAEFQLDEYVKFMAELTMVGRIEASYDAQEHIVSLELAPTQPVDVAFQVTSELQVRTEGLWSSLVGGAASLIGDSPEGRARQQVRQQTTQRMRTRLDKGITVTVNLCTGKRQVQLGRATAGGATDRPTSSGGEQILAQRRAELHSGGLLAAGPFETGHALRAEFRPDEGAGALTASWLCQADAERVAAAYVEGESLEQIPAIAEMIIHNSDTMELPPEKVDCPVVLLIRPSGQGRAPARFSYTITSDGGGPQPIIDCPQHSGAGAVP